MGGDEVRRRAWRVRRQPGAAVALDHAPAEVGAGGMRPREEVDFLLRILSDVADVEVAGHPIEAESPRIAQPQRPDLRPAQARGRERVVRGIRVGRRVVDVDAQHLAEQLVRILRAVARIVAAAAVARADVEQAVRAEAQRAAVVVFERLRDGQQHLRRRGIGAVRIGRARAIRRDHRRAVAGARVVDEEAAVGRVERMKREAEQAALAAGGDQAAEVEKRRRRKGAIAQDADASALLDDEETRSVGGRVDDVDGRRRAGGDQLGANRQHRRGGTCGKRGEQGEKRCERPAHPTASAGRGSRAAAARPPGLPGRRPPADRAWPSPWRTGAPSRR